MFHRPGSVRRVTLEAMALGRPVAAYSHGGVAEQLDVFFPEGMVEPGDIPVMVDKLRRWHTQPPKVSEKPNHPFTLQRFFETKLELYESLMAGGSRRNQAA